MKKGLAAVLTLCLLFTAGVAGAETFEGTDFSIELPDGMTEQPELTDAMRADVAATDDSIEVVYLGATSTDDGVMLAITRAPREQIVETEESATDETLPANGTYDQKLQLASELASWYGEYDPLAFIMDVISADNGATFFVCHCESETGSYLSCETNTAAADYTVNAFYLYNGLCIEPTQAQYDALVATLRSFKQK